MSVIHQIRQIEDFEVGEDVAFERRWSLTQRAAHAAQALLLVVTLAGLLGAGPLAHASARSDASHVAINYDRITHFQAATTIRVAAVPPLPSDSTVSITVNRSYLDRMQLTRTSPVPARVIVDSVDYVYVFARKPFTDSLRVSFVLGSGTSGVSHGKIGIDGTAPVLFTQYVAP